VGQGKEGNREKRVTIRIEPIDYDKIYVWKEGNSNCGKRFKGLRGVKKILDVHKTNPQID
jgi:hypothetical protein